MITPHIQFSSSAGSEGFYKPPSQNTINKGVSKDDLILSFKNRNHNQTGDKMGFNEMNYKKGAVSHVVMNKKTSQVNTDDISLHK